MDRVKELTANKIWLAPLAGFTDVAFRTICRDAGADVVVTEMVSADGLVYDYQKSVPYARFNEAVRPVGIQLFGSDAKIVGKATILAIELKPDFIDFNLGCPVKKVVKRGAGSALLLDLQRAASIVKAMKSELNGTGIPLSVKIRSGWDKDSIVAPEAAKMLEDAGADIIVVHPRTRSQFYSGLSDWSVIKEIKQSVSIPVVGNGDITSPEDALRMKQLTGCDSVMIGRGALGKPWLFGQIRDYLLTKSVQELNYSDRFEIVRRHLELSIKEKGEKRGLIEMRVHLCYYTKGIPGGSRIRSLINQTEKQSDMLVLIRELYEQESSRHYLAGEIRG